MRLLRLGPAPVLNRLVFLCQSALPDRKRNQLVPGELYEFVILPFLLIEKGFRPPVVTAA
jgi:hypothetical protein